MDTLLMRLNAWERVTAALRRGEVVEARRIALHVLTDLQSVKARQDAALDEAAQTIESRAMAKGEIDG